MIRHPIIIALLLTLSLSLPFNAEAKGFGSNRSYHTYTKRHSSGHIYVGRTSGKRTPAENILRRDRNHHMNKDGYDTAKLDKSSKNKDAIRGREQQLIDKHRAEGKSGNKINGISPQNKKKKRYMDAADKEFSKKDKF